MAITFDNSPLKWDEVGVEPSETLKKSGYKPKDNPAAENENFFRHSTYKSIEELQNKSAGLNVEGTVYSIPSGDTTTEVTAGVGAEVFNHYSEIQNAYGNVFPPNRAVGDFSHAEGFWTKAMGVCSHAEGQATDAIGNNTHAEGANTKASGNSSHAQGVGTIASGDYSHAEGGDTEASGNYSHAGGFMSAASGSCSFVHGSYTTADAYNFVIGKFNKATTAASLAENTGDLFVVGSGLQSGAKSNALRVTAAGDVMGVKAYAATGADICHLIEWKDGNPNAEDRRGFFVTLDGDKIRIATSKDDYILGAISSTPSLICNASTDDWHGKFETDEYGERILENGAYKLSDEFDENQDDDYINRIERPEWGIVGHSGIVTVRDDGTCEVNSYCMPNDNGKATKSETGYRVMKRLSKNLVQIFISAPLIINK